jgi:hypothetical protein
MPALREGSLRQAAAEMGIPTLLYEAGEALRFDEVAIRAGLRGVMSVMQAAGHADRQTIAASDIDPLIADTTSWVRAPISGILRMKVPLGGRVAKNSKIGEIADPFGGEEVEIRSPVSGIVIGRLNLPLVHRGTPSFILPTWTASRASNRSSKSSGKKLRKTDRTAGRRIRCPHAWRYSSLCRRRSSSSRFPITTATSPPSSFSVGRGLKTICCWVF